MSNLVDRQGRWIPDGGWPPGKEAPGPLEGVRRFVNTTNRENGAELFDSPAGFDEWLIREKRLPVGTDAAGLSRVIALREALRDLAIANAANADGTDADEAWGRFGAAVSGASLVVINDDGAAILTPATEGLEGLLADLAGAVVLAGADGTWDRLKACSNHHCRWVFWDRSRSRTGAWCSMSVCGQRIKQREYRRRQARG